MTRHRLPCSLALAAALLAPSLAFAVPPAPPAPSAPPDPSQKSASAEADEKAAKWMSIGNKAFRDGKFAEAERAYREAFTVKNGYDIAGNLGVAEMAQGKLKEAAQHFAFTLRMFPITGEPALREQMQKAFDQVKRDVAAVRVTVDVKGAVIMVDGVSAGETPLLDEVFVEPGEHVISAALDDYRGSERRVAAHKGATVEVTLTLTPVPQQPPPVVPEKKRPLAPGLVIAGVAVLGLGGGGAFLGLEGSERSNAQALGDKIPKGCSVHAGPSTPCGKLAESVSNVVTYHNTAIGAFAVGSVAAVGAVAYFFWPSKWLPSLRSGLQVTPVVGAGSASITGSGTF